MANKVSDYTTVSSTFGDIDFLGYKKSEQFNQEQEYAFKKV
jgi:hypothetical protein